VKIKEILEKKNVVESMQARTRDEAIAELVDLVAGRVPLDKDKLVRILVEREEQSPTAMTGGVAVPHGRIKDLDRFVLALGRSKIGVPFGAKEGPIKIFFLLLAPTDDTVSHLKILARLARMCRNSAFRDDLLAARNADELFERVMKEDEAV
jgi:PTS system nitrogen regulatory IIA component